MRTSHLPLAAPAPASAGGAGGGGLSISSSCRWTGSLQITNLLPLQDGSGLLLPSRFLHPPHHPRHRAGPHYQSKPPPPKASPSPSIAIPTAASGQAMNRNWPQGFAMISETRTVTLPPGRSTIRFDGVAEGMVAVCAIVTGLPGGTIEKNRNADLLSPAALVDGMLGNRVTVTRTDPATGEEAGRKRRGPHPRRWRAGAANGGRVRGGALFRPARTAELRRHFRRGYPPIRSSLSIRQTIAAAPIRSRSPISPGGSTGRRITSPPSTKAARRTICASI